MVVCSCLVVTKGQIEECVSQGSGASLYPLKTVMDKLQAGTCCGGCVETIERIVKEATASSSQGLPGSTAARNSNS